MSEQFECDICGAPMKLIRFVGTKESGKSYRQRWFKCEICDYQKKIHANGERDEKLEPQWAIKEAKRVQNQINREP